jgi:hypothetical protein
VTKAVTDLIFRKLEEPREQPALRWDAFLTLGSGNQAKRAAAAAAGASESSIIPAPVRELGSEIVSGVGELVDNAAAAVSEMVEGIVTPSPKANRSSKKENGAKAATKEPTKKSTSTRSKKPTREA